MKLTRKGLYIGLAVLFILLMAIVLTSVYDAFDSGFRMGYMQCLNEIYNKSQLPLPDNPLLK